MLFKFQGIFMGGLVSERKNDDGTIYESIKLVFKQKQQSRAGLSYETLVQINADKDYLADFEIGKAYEFNINQGQFNGNTYYKMAQ